MLHNFCRADSDSDYKNINSSITMSTHVSTHVSTHDSDYENFVEYCENHEGKPYQGYFNALENEPRLGGADYFKKWEYLAARPHGRQVFWGHPKPCWQALGCKIYLQIDEQHLRKDNRKDNRKGLAIRARDLAGDAVKVDKLQALFESAQNCAPLIGGIKVTQPTLFKSAITSNVATLSFAGASDQYLATDKDDIIDFDATVQRLVDAMQLVQKMCQDQRQDKLAVD